MIYTIQDILVDRSDVLALLQGWKPRLLQRQLLRYALAIAALAAYVATESADLILAAQRALLLCLALTGMAMLLAYQPGLALLVASLGIPPCIELAKLKGRDMSERLSNNDRMPYG